MDALNPNPDQPPVEPVAARMSELREQLRHHGHLYYVLDAPTLPDVAYDRLFRELQSLEQAYPQWRSTDSPTQRVGGAPVAAFASVEHKVPMLSIQTETDISEQGARLFDQRVRKQLQCSEHHLPNMFHRTLYWE